MTEIRIHARRSQGCVAAANILEQAALMSGQFAQALATVGPDCADQQLKALVQIYKIRVQRDWPGPDPVFLILQDHTMLHSLGVTDELPAMTRVLVNWSKPVEPTTVNGHDIVLIPAASMAMEFTGKPMPNVALLAALVAMTEVVPMKALEKALSMRFRDEALERNLRLTREVAQMFPAGIWNETNTFGQLRPPPNALLH